MYYKRIYEIILNIKNEYQNIIYFMIYNYFSQLKQYIAQTIYSLSILVFPQRCKIKYKIPIANMVIEVT